MLAVNGTHRLPDALAPLINVQSGAEGDKPTPNVSPNVTKRCLSFIGPKATERTKTPRDLN